MRGLFTGADAQENAGAEDRIDKACRVPGQQPAITKKTGVAVGINRLRNTPRRDARRLRDMRLQICGLFADGPFEGACSGGFFSAFEIHDVHDDADAHLCRRERDHPGTPGVVASRG